MKKGTVLYSIFRLRCPNCHEGKLFTHKLYNLKKVGSMNSECSSCGLVYSKEPGFYFGAAYVSYGVSVAIAVAICVFGYLLQQTLAPNLSWYTILGFVVASLVLLFPVSYGVSRAIWLNMFYSYGKGPKQGA